MARASARRSSAGGPPPPGAGGAGGASSDIASPDVALDAVRNLDRKVLEYSPSEGYASYREGLAAYAGI